MRRFDKKILFSPLFEYNLSVSLSINTLHLEILLF